MPQQQQQQQRVCHLVAAVAVKHVITVSMSLRQLGGLSAALQHCTEGNEVMQSSSCVLPKGVCDVKQVVLTACVLWVLLLRLLLLLLFQMPTRSLAPT
jgi:hypothetical protein